MKCFLKRIFHRRPKSKVEAGRLAEREAARFLQSKGMEIIARNVCYRDGEVDIVAREGETLVFVEVKARSSEEFGSGAEAVTPQKRGRIIRGASRFMAGWGREVVCRFDIIEVKLDNLGKPVGFRHLKGAFGEERVFPC